MMETNNEDSIRNAADMEPIAYCKSVDACAELFNELKDNDESFSIIYVSVHDLNRVLADVDEKTAAQVISVLSSRLVRCVRGGDSAFQVNNSDYLVIIRGAYAAGAYESLQERIRSIIEEEVVIGDQRFSVSVSFGFANCPDDGQSMEALVETARGSMERSLHSVNRASALEKELATETTRAAQSEQHADTDDTAAAGEDVSAAVSLSTHARQFIDELTGLPDSQLFRRRANEIISDANKRMEGLTMVFCDIEEFKTYNLKHGYMAGDDLLKFMADMLVEAFPGQPVARLNSDRFCVLAHTEGVVERLEKAHEAVKEFRSNSSAEFKAGLYDILDENISASQAQDYARLACDSIKGRFDINWRRYDAHLAGEVSRRQYIVDNLTTAINAGWIETYYQPIVRSLSGHVCSLEALVRWNDPELGMLPPGEFIDVLEEARLIHTLDIQVVKQVCRAGARYIKEGKQLISVSVNLSRLDYQLCDIFAVVDQIVSESGFPRDKLHIEFTESAFTHDSEIFTQVIDRFRSAGYQVWMDDFGSGYSSLNLLKDYDFDVLKIDMEFLRGLSESPRTRDIVVSVIDMAKKLGIRTLAEGVETEEQSHFLSSIGCEMQQGYLFSKPVPVNELDDVYERLQKEQQADSEYYQQLGRVNLLSASPFERAEGTGRSMEFSLVLPLAIVQRVDDSLSVIVSTSSFDDVVEEVELFDRDGDVVVPTSDKGRRVVKEVLQLGSTSDTNNAVKYVSFYDFQDLYTLRMQHLASSGERHAYLIALERHDTSKGSMASLASGSAGGIAGIGAEGQSGGKMIYLPQAQKTPWQQGSSIDKSRTALVVVDVLGGGEGVVPGLEEAAANCVKLAKAARKADIPVIFTIDNHIAGLDHELELWGDHGVRNTPSGTPLDDFEVSDIDLVIPKRRYNGFFQTDLDLTLRELGVDTLIMVGYDTNICVNHTLAGAYYNGYRTIVPADATATFLVGEQEAGLDYFVRCYDTRVVDTETVMGYFEAE